MRFGIVVAVVLVGAGVAIAVMLGWFALTVYACMVAVSALLGTVVAVFNRSGGSLAQSAGRLTYDRWMGNRR